LWPIIRNLRQYVVPVRLAPAVSFFVCFLAFLAVQSNPGVIHVHPCASVVLPRRIHDKLTNCRFFKTTH
jgi:hypothetical protein